MAGEKSLQNTQIAERKDSVQYIDSQFKISETVNHLHSLMKEVTKDKIDANSVNAACNCVHNLNLTIKTTIAAAKFINDIND